MLHHLSQPNKPKATIREGMLVLSLTNAISPVVWRLDMRKVSASALEVRENDNARYDLVLKTQKSDVNHIASFENKQEALDALKVVMRAIENAPLNDFHLSRAVSENKQSTAHQNNTKSTEIPDIPSTISSRNRPVLAGAIGAGVVVLLLIVLGWIGSAQQAGQNSASLVSPRGTAAETTGKPVSADEFLRSRRN